jgi:hypothetical protein
MTQPVVEHAHTSDLDAIRDTAMDYVQGYYEGDAERMRRSLHPQLVKRGFKRDSASQSQFTRTLGQDDMVALTAAGGGSQDVPAEKRYYDISQVDISGEIASAKAVSAEYVDYLHLAHWEGRWVIVNVLWAFRAPDA